MLYLIILFFSMPFMAFADVVVVPGALNIEGECGETFSKTLHFINDEKVLNIDFMSASEGIAIEPASVHLEPGEELSVTVHGIIPEEEASAIISLSDRDDVPYLLALNFHAAIPDPREDDLDEIGSSSIDPYIFFYTPGCHICETFYADYLPELNEELGLEDIPQKLNIYESENFELMTLLLEERQKAASAFPILVHEDVVLVGEDEIYAHLPALLKDEQPEHSGELTSNEALPVLKAFPLFMAGLLDGVNPCAFTTLIFLISYLRLLGSRKKSIFQVGIAFTLAVFLSYFSIGLGLFKVIQMASSFTYVASIINWGMIAFLLILAALSFYDLIKVKQGKPEASFLQLSAKNKKKIHKRVRTSVRSPLLLLSSFVAGVVISVYELGCTGQIYLPMIIYMIKEGNNLGSYFLLLLYNIGFILPLCLVFVLFYKGVDSKRFETFYRSHLGVVKLLTACLFLLMALITLFL